MRRRPPAVSSRTTSPGSASPTVMMPNPERDCWRRTMSTSAVTSSPRDVAGQADDAEVFQVEQPEVGLVVLTDTGEQRVRRERVHLAHGRVEAGSPGRVRSAPRFGEAARLGEVKDDGVLVDLDRLQFGQWID